MSCFTAYRSGTEERDLSAIQSVQTAERAANRKKIEEDKRKGEEMRRAAMEGIGSMFVYCFYLDFRCVTLVRYIYIYIYIYI